MCVKEERLLVLAPFLVTLFPAVHAFSNPQFFLPDAARLVLVISLAVSILLFSLTKLLRSWQRASLISTVIAGTFALFSLPVSLFGVTAINCSNTALALILLAWCIIWGLVVWSSYSSSVRALNFLIVVVVLGQLSYSALLRLSQTSEINRDIELGSDSKIEYVVVFNGLSAPRANGSAEEKSLWRYLEQAGFKIGEIEPQSASEVISGLITERKARSRIELVNGGVVRPAAFPSDKYWMNGQNLWLREHLVKYFPIPIFSHVLSRQLFNNQRAVFFAAIEKLMQKREVHEPTTILAHFPFPAGPILFSGDGEVVPDWVVYDDSFGYEPKPNTALEQQYLFLLARIKELIDGISRTRPDAVINIISSSSCISSCDAQLFARRDPTPRSASDPIIN